MCLYDNMETDYIGGARSAIYIRGLGRSEQYGKGTVEDKIRVYGLCINESDTRTGLNFPETRPRDPCPPRDRSNETGSREMNTPAGLETPEHLHRS